MPGPARKEIRDGKRQCSGCKDWKTLDQFTKDRHISDGLDTKCKACKSIHNTRQKGSRYGISREEYLRMFDSQRGLCASCGEPETHRYKGKDEVKALAVDHNHTTGKIRGLLCADCNMAEGHLKTPEKILALYMYISKHRV